MKQDVPPMIALTIGLLIGTPFISQAQTTFLPAVAPPTFVPISNAAPANYGQTKTLPSAVDAEPDSVTTLLGLNSARIAQLDQAYNIYARARLVQEAQIANWQDELRTAQAATTFNERKASGLSASVSAAENKIATAYLKARGAALAALTSTQRVQLEKLETENRPVRDDKYRFLLLSQVEDLWRTPIDPETGQALLSSSAGASKPAQQNYYQNYYSAPPVYSSPYYGYGWNSYNYNYNYNYGWDTYNYGVQYPFYARPSYGWNDGGYYGNNRVDKNARARWDRSGPDARPSPNYGSQAPWNTEPRRPLFTPQNSSDGGTRPSAERPRVERRPDAPAAPQWERQRESPRPTPPSNNTPQRPESSRPEQPRPEPPRTEPTRPDPPRSEPRQPEQNNSDAGSRWNRGGGGGRGR